MTNQIKNFIDEEKKIEEEFIEILEYGKDLTSEEVWTDLEKIQWLRKSMKSYKISLIKMIVEMVESEKNGYTEYREKGSDEFEKAELLRGQGYNTAIDTISSKLKTLNDGK